MNPLLLTFSSLLFFFTLPPNILAQDGVRKVTFTVLDERGTPIVGASVLGIGDAIMGITNQEGQYYCHVNNSLQNAYVSHIDYEAREVPILGKQEVYVVLLVDTSKPSPFRWIKYKVKWLFRRIGRIFS